MRSAAPLRCSDRRSTLCPGRRGRGAAALGVHLQQVAGTRPLNAQHGLAQRRAAGASSTAARADSATTVACGACPARRRSAAARRPVRSRAAQTRRGPARQRAVGDGRRRSDERCAHAAATRARPSPAARERSTQYCTVETPTACAGAAPISARSRCSAASGAGTDDARRAQAEVRGPGLDEVVAPEDVAASRATSRTRGAASAATRRRIPTGIRIGCADARA